MSKNKAGIFVLENSHGEVVRTFHWDSSQVNVVFRQDSRRIETVAQTKDLEKNKIPYLLLAKTTATELRKNPVRVGDGQSFRGQLRFAEDPQDFATEVELEPENNEEFKRIAGISSAVVLAVFGLLLIIGNWIAPSVKKETAVTLIPEAVVEKMIQDQNQNKEQTKTVVAPQIKQIAAKVPASKIVVEASETKLTAHSPVPTRSSKHTAHHALALTHHSVRAGGYKSSGPRGYGTDEAFMNQIASLNALDQAEKSNGGNGGHGGRNRQAVGYEAGSGAGGKGYGGFGSNGAGGKGLGGIGHGKGMGIANSMYGKGLIAAPFGDGSPAPGAGGYGTRGKAGGGAQGVGYGAMTIVGSWKGTGPKGDGPSGSGAGRGGSGSPWGDGSAETDDDDAVITGGLDMDAVRDVILRNLGQITYCYEQGLQREPKLSGRVTMRFQIGGQGMVNTLKIAHSSVHSSLVENCMAGKVRNWKFPKPQGGVNVAVTYPFLLRRVTSR